MFDFNYKTLDFGKKNTIINKKVNLDSNLECFILISTSDAILADNILNKILDLIIDKIGKEDSYGDFSISLQNINSFLKIWSEDSGKHIKINILIGILNENMFFFSEIGKVSCYLIKNNNDFIDVTDKQINKKYFGFISSGELSEGETVIMGTHKLLNYLSNSDFIDGARLKKLSDFIENIVVILKGEIIEKNIGIIGFNYKETFIVKSTFYNLYSIKNLFFKNIDNDLFKNFIKFSYIFRDFFIKSSKNIKNIILVIGILISFLILYSIVLNMVGNNSYIEKKIEYTIDLNKAKGYVNIATENINNSDIFNLNIKKAERIIKVINEKKLFLNDLNKMKDDIGMLKKQFNGVEVFDENLTNKIFSHNITSPIKTFKKDNKIYIINNNTVFLLDSEKVKLQPFLFDKLEDNESFIDVTVSKNNIVLLTNKSKIVTFSKGYFNFSDVNGQDVWETSKDIESFGNNIYLLGENENQIYKHSKSGNRYNSSSSYLKTDDINEVGNIVSIAIDGGIYILKEDLSILKFFSSPKYRLEKIVLNNLPKNYDIENTSSKIELKTRSNLNYVYILLNNKIWIFKPNRKAYNDVKSLLFLGQIEGRDYDIIDFYPSHDGELIILNKSGLYKLEFDITKDDKIILR